MKNKTKKYFIVAGALFLLFFIFTLIVSYVDVKPIGPKHSYVGLATLNQFIFHLTGVNLDWYHITNCLGIVSILFAFGFAMVGVHQLIQRKSLWKIDQRILVLGLFYIVVILFYIIFEFVIINYRPVLLEKNLEASYPSSHTMLVICIMGSALLQFRSLFQRDVRWQKRANILCWLLMGVMVIGRSMAGVHWFTDIIAGVILSTALLMLYYAVVLLIEEKQGKIVDKL